MKTTTRTAAVLLAAAVTFGPGSPVAATDAADPAKPGHVRADKGDHGKGDHGKGASKKGSQELRQLLRDLDKADARLAKVAKESRTSRIGDHAAAVLANVAADRAALAELRTAVAAPDSSLDPREVRRELKELRIQNFGKAINDLRHALKLTEKITDARADAEGDAAALAVLDAAQAAVDSAVAKALLISATSDRSELRAVRVDLQAAHAALDGLPEDESETETEDEDETDDDSEDEPVEPTP